MSGTKTMSLKILLSLVLGLAVGSVFTTYVSSNYGMAPEKNNDDGLPLYWVAPMDSNYRRDQPGKSPMGMDLVPVFKDEPSENDAGPGTISVSPDVVNNLGVRTGLAELKKIQSEVVTVGYVQFDEGQLTHIHPRLSGWVEELYVKAAGDPVKKGAPLYALYSPELVNAQEELVLAINRKNKRLIKAAEERLYTLQLSRPFINKLKRTKSVKQVVTFYAPQKGVVHNLNIRKGFYVQPGTTMLSIGSLNKVWVEAEVFERQAALINTSDHVSMTLDYLPGRSWGGRIDYIYPTLNEKTRTARIRLIFDNKDGALKPNMFAQVKIHSNSKKQLLLIPSEALIRTGRQDRVVLALGEGRFKSIEVEVGHIDNNYAEVTSGLIEGDKVVISAQFLMDSESSKSSDFKRMHHGQKEANSVWVNSTIKTIMVGHRMVTVEHDAIDEWGWSSMTMDFEISESVDLSAFHVGSKLKIQITKNKSGGIIITGTQPTKEKEDKNNNTATVKGVINDVDIKNGKLNISRGPIEKWGRPAAIMDFIADEGVVISKFEKGEKIKFTFKKSNSGFVITHIEQE